jgi:hypothetical protein
MRNDDLTATMAQPLGDALPGLRIQLAVDNSTTGHRRQLTCHRAVVICRTWMPQSLRNAFSTFVR